MTELIIIHVRPTNTAHMKGLGTPQNNEHNTSHTHNEKFQVGPSHSVSQNTAEPNTASKTYIPCDIQHSGTHWSYHHIDRGSQLCGEGESYGMEEVKGKRRKTQREGGKEGLGREGG